VDLATRNESVLDNPEKLLVFPNKKAKDPLLCELVLGPIAFLREYSEVQLFAEAPVLDRYGRARLTTSPYQRSSLCRMC
jgi:hypothetical protein